MDAKEKDEIIFEGIAASPGLAHGRAFVVVQSDLEIPVYQIDPSQKEGEIGRFEQALLATRQQVMRIKGEVAHSLGDDEARIFDAHLLVLEDQALFDETIRELDKTSKNIEACFQEVGRRYVLAFGEIDDEYLRERANDIRDVVERVLHNLTGRTMANLSKIAEDRILITQDISPSESAALDQSGTLAIVTQAGSKTSHAVIMARSMKIPAVVGVEGVTDEIGPDDWVMVDGYDGLVIVNPSEKTLFRYGQISVQRKSFEKKILKSVKEPARTLDGVNVTLLANIESAKDLEQSRAAGAEGVGLYRTEYLFLQTEVIPSEEMQYQAYRHVAEYFGSNQVVIRTMDLGGDKSPGSGALGMVGEANPFLGFRAIRFCLENPDLFKDQLRAILRASAHGNVKVMFPMISGREELDRALEMVDEAKKELRERGIKFNENIDIGSMIEIPSAAIAADLLATRCDFFSVGTNDLIQYLLAVDRVNTRTAHLYEPTHPAVLRTLKNIFDAAHSAGIKSAICGEVAGDPVLVPLLLGLGADELSASPALLPTVKYLVKHMKMSDAVKLAKDALKTDDPKEIAAACQEFYRERVGEPE